MVVRNQRDENFRAVLCDTKTGRNVITEVPMLNPKWGLRLNAPGQVSIDIPVGAREAKKMDIRNATTTLSRSLGIAYGGTMLECGPILNRSYDPETERLSLTAAGLWSILNRRKLLQAIYMQNPTAAPGQVLTLGPLGLSAIMRELIRMSTADNPYAGGTAGNLNIVLPSKAEPGTHTRTYNGFDLRWTGEALTELADGGVDLRLRPRFMEAEQTRVEWLFESGSEAQPLLKQPGPPWRFDGTVKNGPVVGFGGSEDATKVAARAWRVGAGQERDIRFGVATDTSMVDVGMPWTETDTADKQQTRDDLLADGAATDLQATNAPTGNISVTVRADMYPGLGMYWPGDYAAIVIPDGNPIFAPGPRACRILAVDGSDSQNVQLTLAPFLNKYQGSPYAAATTTTNGGRDIALGAAAQLGPNLNF